jgi:hypothetical protein
MQPPMQKWHNKILFGSVESGFDRIARLFGIAEQHLGVAV